MTDGQCNARRCSLAGRPQANSMEAIIRQEAVLPRDAMCQSKLCQLLQHNSVETSCTTNPEQIEVMELEGYSRQMCNKLCACSHDAVDRRKCNSQARPSTSLLITSSTCQSETVTSPQFAAKFQREVPLFWRYPNFLITQFRISKEAAMPKNTALSI